MGTERVGALIYTSLCVCVCLCVDDMATFCHFSAVKTNFLFVIVMFSAIKIGCLLLVLNIQCFVPFFYPHDIVSAVYATATSLGVVSVQRRYCIILKLF